METLHFEPQRSIEDVGDQSTYIHTASSFRLLENRNPSLSDVINTRTSQHEL